MKIKPITFLFVYLGLIILYASLFFFVPGLVEEKDWTSVKSLYFSVVTITTLGYGEITPKSNLGMLLAASEAVLGIVIIGLFLNALWQSFAKKIEIQQEASIKSRIEEQNLHTLSSFYKYLKAVISDYEIALAELTTPMSKRGDQLEPNPKFIFSDLQDLYNPSLLTKSGFKKPVIRLYYEKLDLLLDELKFLISNVDLTRFPKLHNLVIEFLALSRSHDLREVLLSYESMKAGDEMMKDTLAKMIREHDQCPDLEKYKSNVITPVILLYQVLKFQMIQIKMLVEEFEQIMANKEIQPTSYVGG